MRLVLPYPVSANRYWRSFVPRGWTRPVVHPSDEAKAYKAACKRIALAAGCWSPRSGPIALSLILVPKNGVVMDLSNCLKVAEDALQGLVYVNDKQVRQITLNYGDADGVGALVVDITDFYPEPGPLFRESTRALA